MDLNHIRPDSLIQTSVVKSREKVTTYTYTYKAMNGTGNVWDNAITGSNGKNILSGLDGNDTLTGLDGNDQLLGGLGHDVLDGGLGRDSLNGGNGTDVLTGGTGNDVFIFSALSDSPAGLDRDTITDFSKGDRIDLRGIDANEAIRGNQAFRYIADGDFSGKAGELRFDPNTHLLQGDVNGDGIPEVEILLSGIEAISRSQIQL
jgi:Ca2+-binding RTX toxin-like protein